MFQNTPSELYITYKNRVKREWKLAFCASLIIGLCTHLPVFMNDWPNHDGLASIYFNQNMITSGRWFLQAACGLTSYFTVPWLIGLLSVFYLSLTAVCVIELLEIKENWLIILTSGLLVTFPALASMYAYIFTADGYTLALLLAVSAVLLTKNYSKWGYIGGAFCLAFSMGIYQSYLAVTMLLSIYMVLLICMEGETKTYKGKKILPYLLMGVLGILLYYGILQLLLFIEGTSLSNYQGISEMTGVGATGIGAAIVQIYRDFAAFSIKGNVVWNNEFSGIAWIILFLIFAVTFIHIICTKKYYKSIWFYAICWACIIFVPLASNMILLVSPGVNYHLLMRYQWVLFPILILNLATRQLWDKKVLQWGCFIAAFVLTFNYAVMDNVGYSNLEKKYEKTYAYCLRLVDRMEQTDGYYQGIPVAMIGIVSEEQYPSTDLSLSVTSGMIGLNGDYLCYTGHNYQEFMKNYMGVTLNVIDNDKMEAIYDSEAYRALDSFPGANSTKVVDGVLYVKTEPIETSPAN